MLLTSVTLVRMSRWTLQSLTVSTVMKSEHLILFLLNCLSYAHNFSRFEEVQDEAVQDEAEEPPKPAKRPREVDEKEGKPTKAEKKKNKKLKKDNGEAVPVGDEETKSKTADEKAEKKAEKKHEKKGGKAEKEGKHFKELKGGLKVKDDSTGTGPQAKKGDKLQMRYIGKLLDGKIFDKNTKGKPVGDSDTPSGGISLFFLVVRSYFGEW